MEATKLKMKEDNSSGGFIFPLCFNFWFPSFYFGCRKCYAPHTTFEQITFVFMFIKLKDMKSPQHKKNVNLQRTCVNGLTFKYNKLGIKAKTTRCTFTEIYNQFDKTLKTQIIINPNLHLHEESSTNKQKKSQSIVLQSLGSQAPKQSTQTLEKPKNK